MPSLPRLSPLALALLAALVGACTGKNVDHCNFRGGDAFCGAEPGARPYCSVCAADFNGCVDAPPDAACLPEGSSSASASGTTAPTSSSSASSDVSASAGSGSTSTSTSTTGASTSSTGTSTGESTSEGTGTSSGTGTSTSSTGTDGSTTNEGPMCGNDVAEGNEICDGSDLRGKTCVDFGWSGGQLGCAANCGSYDQQKCCKGEGSKCSFGECCAGLTCLGECWAP